MKRKIKISYSIDRIIDINSFLTDINISKDNILKLYQTKGIYVNSKLVLENKLLLVNDTLVIYLYEESQDFYNKPGYFDIVYEDDYLLVINKPANLNVMSNKQYYEENLACYVLDYLNKKEIYGTVHLVNRLDNLTEGLLIIAKHGIIHHMFESIEITKKYYVRVEGHLSNKKDTITIPIMKLNSDIKRVVNDKGKPSTTIYEVVKENSDSTDIIATLVTGRTHQLRLTFSYLGHPIIGDKLYGSKISSNLCLCSSYLSFVHPIYKKRMEFSIHPSF